MATIMMDRLPRAHASIAQGVARPAGSAGEIAGFAVIVAALYFGRDILIPLALAIIVAFALSPIVLELRRIGLRRIPSVLLVFLAFVTCVVGAAILVSNQLIDLAANLPQYRGNLETKIETFREAAPAGGVVDRVWRMAADLSTAVSEAFGAAGVAAERPLAVRIESDDSALVTVWAVLEPMLAPVGQIGIMLVFVVFLLMEREDLRNRLIWLLGDRDLTRATAALNDAATRLGRLLLAQAGLNLAYGITFAAGLWVIGVPNPLLWGTIAGILRFIPIIGTIVGAVLPAFMAFAADPGWTMAIATIGLVIALDILANNVIEPLLYGNRTGLSAFAVLLAMVFWVTMWGIPGLLLATPLTICLAVLGRHVPRLAFFDVLLSSAPALSPEARFYQRILAEDPIEASELAEQAMAGGSRRTLFETMIVPAIRRAHEDRRRGALEGANRRAVWHGIRVAVEDLDADDPPLDATTPTILCVAARDDLDAACAEMVRQLLAEEAFRAITIAPGERPEAGVFAACILCWAHPPTPAAAERAMHRVRRSLGDGVRIVLAAPTAGPVTIQALVDATAVPVAATLADAVVHAAEVAPEARMTQTDAPADAAEVPAPDRAAEAVPAAALRPSPS